MSTHKALVLPEPRGTYVVQEVPTPKPGPGQLLVEVKAAGLNPVDWKVRDYGVVPVKYPIILGSDAAGVVKEVGEGVTEFKAGDRVLHQGYFTGITGTFQQYSIVPAEITAKLPPNLSFDQGATIPLVLITAVYGLYSGKVATGELRGSGHTPFWEEGGRGKYANKPILIIGGSSAVGQQAIQVAKHSGFSPIITTASPRNTDLLKSLGATHVIDRSVALAPAVKAITSTPFDIVFDAISLKETQQPAYDILAPGGTLLLVLPPSLDESSLDQSKNTVYILGTAHDQGQNKLAVSLYKNLTGFLERGEIKPNNVEVVPNGLAGIPEGLDRLKADQVSAKKLVAHPWD